MAPAFRGGITLGFRPARKLVFRVNEMTPVPSNTVHTESPDVAAGPDDLELVARSQAGDTSAFNELVTRYRNRAYAMIYNMVRNEQDAWDLAQDGFLKAFNLWPFGNLGAEPETK